MPDAEFQELALAGVETLVSTRLDPGVDPIVEADRRGTILAIIRVGNKDLEIPGGGGGAGWSAAVDGDGQGGVVQTGYGGMPMACGPAGAGGPGGGSGWRHGGRTCRPPFVAGMTAPQYGMPITGTPIGLPGPPHIPMGIPAGLQAHSIKNMTKSHIPGPVKHFRMNVKQEPGFNYPDPVLTCTSPKPARSSQALVQAAAAEQVSGRSVTAPALQSLCRTAPRRAMGRRKTECMHGSGWALSRRCGSGSKGGIG